MSALTPQLRAPCASRGSVRSVSSLDCGAAEPRQAYGGAAFSGGRSISARERFARDGEIVRLATTGVRQKVLAARYVLSQGAISLIVAAARDEADRRERLRIIAEREDRRERLLDLYEAGYSLAEIGRANSISTPRVARILSQHPGYKPRNAFPRFGFNADVPAWVPGAHASRFRHLAALEGEEIAASCLRKLKRLEAQSA